jgi:hypothetical protein
MINQGEAVHIHYDPDEFEAVVTRRTCPFHQESPGEQFAGCTCVTGYEQRRRSREEIAAIKGKKRREEEDHILAQAELIRAQRKHRQE